MIYRKRGSVVRYENGTVVRVTESGVAVEEGDCFTCEPGGEQAGLPVPSFAFAAEAGEAGVPVLDVPCTIERLVMVRGVSEHEYGDRTWREETERLHLSLVHGRERALIDQADFELTHIHRVAAALVRVGAEREAPPRLRLAPNVTAAIVPSLVGLAPPNVRLVQTAGGTDGRGEPIVETEGGWPNWYRPSYRVRPFRAPLDLRLECAVTRIEEDRPIAIALLAPPNGLTIRVLVEEGVDVYPSTVRVTRIDAVSDARKWYPYGGGSFGAELML